MKKIVYSPGEPSGIGIDLIIKLSNSKQWEALNIPVLTLSDPILLKERAKLIDQKIKIENIEKCDYLLCTGLFDQHDKDLDYYKKLLISSISKNCETIF